MHGQPSANGSNGRDSRGRFTVGNAGGPGNPYGRKTAQIRSALMRAVKIQDIREIVRALIDRAKGGDVVADLGDMLRRIQLPNSKKKALGHPEVMSAVLHLYSMGYRRYFLYGVWHWVDVEEHAPAIREEMRRLRSEIERLRREKPRGWGDLSARYADAIVGLEEAIAKYGKPRK